MTFGTSSTAYCGLRSQRTPFGRAALAWIAASLLALLGGCTVGPDFVAPAAPPVSGYLPGKEPSAVSDQVVSYNSRIPGAWWQLFGSRELNALIEQGLLHNADLEAAVAAIRVAEANALALRGGFWPTVAGSWESSRQLTPSNTLQSNSASDKSIYSLHTAQLTVGYAPDVFGGLRRQVEAAEAQIETQQMQREAVALTLTANLALAAIQMASFDGQIAATQKLIDIQQEQLRILRRQQSAGQIALTDVLAQETAAAQARTLLPPLERQRDQQRNVIAVLAGRFPAEMGSVRFSLTSFRVPRQLPVSLPGDIVRLRPDIRIAEASVKQANAQIGAAIAARLPQLTLSANGGSTAEMVSKLFSPGTWFGMIAGNVAQSIFDGRTLEMKQRAAEATFVQQTAQYRSVVLTAFQNVADVLLALETDGRALAAARDAEIAANRSLELFRQQLQQGQVSLPTLLTAQQAFLQTSLAKVQAEAARLSDAVALFQAVGGGWWDRQTEAAALQNGTERLMRTVNR